MSVKMTFFYRMFDFLLTLICKIPIWDNIWKKVNSSFKMKKRGVSISNELVQVKKG